jgi:hypothetical protein
MAILELERDQIKARIRKRSETDFNTDYKGFITREEIRKDTLSFLAEYRLGTQKHDYEYLLIDGKLKDTDRSEEMTTKMQFALWERSLHGLPTRREEAELRGIQKLESQLKTMGEDDVAIWASPPGPKEENYGEYGFVFLGRVREEDGQRKLKMTAVRIGSPTINQFNQALSSFTGQEVVFTAAEQFLESPAVVRKMRKKIVDKVLLDSFGFEEDVLRQARDREILKELEESGLLDDFVEIMQYGTQREKQRALNIIQNWVIDMQKNQEEKTIFSNLRIDCIAHRYDHKPPEAKGSCPGSSSNALNKTNSVGSLGEEKMDCVTCPFCKKTVDAILKGGKIICPECNASAERN